MDLHLARTCPPLPSHCCRPYLRQALWDTTHHYTDILWPTCSDPLSYLDSSAPRSKKGWAFLLPYSTAVNTLPSEPETLLFLPHDTFPSAAHLLHYMCYKWTLIWLWKLWLLTFEMSGLLTACHSSLRRQGQVLPSSLLQGFCGTCRPCLYQ